MAGCPSCGRENPDDARFCNACGAPLAPPEPARESRKVVTVLFCDVVGSTALGEATDPEALRARMRRYFEDLRAILERHGGSVEKFAGDAVMAVFGIPVAHEDDALRAVRAASEMRDAIAGHGLEARIGVNTGEVVVGGDSETLVTGDAVNVAARLEQAAASGQILIGPRTRMLVRDAVRAEAVEPLALKGKSEPVEAYRLLEVIGDAPPLARHPETPLVGRERERQRLWRDYEDAVADRNCRLFTLLGPAGIGKSRLVADFLERVGDSADVLRGRCLSYGEGITYWPLVEILLAIGVEPDSVIGSSPPETQLAFRRLLEARAAERPQVVVVDDLQWAEPVFVDLVEHVADLSRDSPIFLLCVARTELLDARPDWGGGKLNATSLLLEPLGAEECAELMEHLASDAVLDVGLRDRITVASAGNPLFVEEMLAMVREHGDGDVVVPPTIQALLQARIDSLEGDVRTVMERGSVEGEVFHRGAVSELSPDTVRAHVESHLTTLVRKELIRSTTPTFADDEGFRFRHLLIRDAAYESLPKATRAELHERFADWLLEHDLVERDEIVGHHVAQAHGYRTELNPADPQLDELARRAAQHLGDAGVGAMDRGDWGAARSLLRRARALLPEGSDARAALGPNLVFALTETGEMEEAADIAAEAASARDPLVRAHGILAEAEIHVLGAGPEAEAALARRDETLPVLVEIGDELGLALYWRSVGYDWWARCRCAEARKAYERALEHAQAAAAERIAYELQTLVLATLVFGPTPVSGAMVRAQQVLDSSSEGSLRWAAALRAVAVLLVCQGRVDEGRAMYARGAEVFRAAGLHVTAAGWSMSESAIERRAGDADAEERVLREGYATLTALSDRFFLPTVASYLAGAIANRTEGPDAEIEELCTVIRERTIAGDVVNFIVVDAVEARMEARRGRFDDALALARRSVAAADETDFYDLRGNSRLALAEVLSRKGERDELERLAANVLSIYESKGDVTGLAWARRRLESLGASVA